MFGRRGVEGWSAFPVERPSPSPRSAPSQCWMDRNHIFPHKTNITHKIFLFSQVMYCNATHLINPYLPTHLKNLPEPTYLPDLPTWLTYFTYPPEIQLQYGKFTCNCSTCNVLYNFFLLVFEQSANQCIWLQHVTYKTEARRNGHWWTMNTDPWYIYVHNPWKISSPKATTLFICTNI